MFPKFFREGMGYQGNFEEPSGPYVNKTRAVFASMEQVKPTPGTGWCLPT